MKCDKGWGGERREGERERETERLATYIYVHNVHT